MKEIRIRAACEQDVLSIIAICKDSMMRTYGPFLGVEAMKPWVEGDLTDRYVTRGWPKMRVAEREAAVVGVAAVDSDLTDLLWVREDARGGGIGSLLMDDIEQDLARRHPFARVECFEPNTRAVEFYRRRGYETARRSEDPDAGVTKLEMAKKIQ